jgi:hypothetical protein
MQQSNVTSLSLLVICLFLLLLLMRTCGALGEAESNAMYLDSLNNEYVVRINQDSTWMYSQSIQLAIAGARIKALELREPEVVIRYQTRTKIKTEIQLGETVYIDSFPHMRLPRYFHRPGKWLEIGGQINRLGRLQLDSIIIPVSYTVAIGDTLRKGFLSRKRDKVVRLGIDNPYVTVTGMNNIIVPEPPKKWWQTNAAKVGLGALIGFGIARAQN